MRSLWAAQAVSSPCAHELPWLDAVLADKPESRVLASSYRNETTAAGQLWQPALFPDVV